VCDRCKFRSQVLFSSLRFTTPSFQLLPSRVLGGIESSLILLIGPESPFFPLLSETSRSGESMSVPPRKFCDRPHPERFKFSLVVPFPGRSLNVTSLAPILFFSFFFFLMVSPPALFPIGEAVLYHFPSKTRDFSARVFAFFRTFCRGLLALLPDFRLWIFFFFFVGTAPILLCSPSKREPFPFCFAFFESRHLNPSLSLLPSPCFVGFV